MYSEDLIDEEIEAIKQAAAKRVSDWLTVPQDLQKLDNLRANVLNKKLITEAQLKALVDNQLESARDGLHMLHTSYEKICQVRNKYTSAIHFFWGVGLFCLDRLTSFSIIVLST